MDQTNLLRPPAGTWTGALYRWHISLRRPLPTAERMTAGEQMFFLGAPLAHVVEYERHLRTLRVSGPGRDTARLTRIAIRWPAEAVAAG